MSKFHVPIGIVVEVEAEDVESACEFVNEAFTPYSAYLDGDGYSLTVVGFSEAIGAEKV